MNVVFIVLDSLRRDRLSIYNEEVGFTQNIEEFAEDAAVYENAVAQAPWTLPSHASMFTGLYPWEHGATQRNPYFESDETLLAESFQENGYRTASFSYNVFLTPSSRLTDGFDTVENFSGLLEKLVPGFIERNWERWLVKDGFERLKNLINRTGNAFFHGELTATSNPGKVLSSSRDFIQEVSEDENFFLFMNLMEAHEPYYPPKEYLEKHAEDIDPSDICQDPAKYLSGKQEADFEDIGKVYDACIDYLDDELGEFLDFVEEELEDTMVVICSDHGQMHGEEDIYGHQFSVGEQLVHVPLMIKTPEGSEGRIEDQVELRQLYGKILSVTGLDEDCEFGQEYALGGYQFPDMSIKVLSKSVREKYYRRFRFVRTPEKKLVESEQEDGEKQYCMRDLDTGEEIDIEENFMERIESIGKSESKGDIEDRDEEVKKRLEKLGYMNR